jgi:hypothetical protein
MRTGGEPAAGTSCTMSRADTPDGSRKRNMTPSPRPGSATNTPTDHRASLAAPPAPQGSWAGDPAARWRGRHRDLDRLLR